MGTKILDKIDRFGGNVTAGLYIPEKNLLITGHSYGVVLIHEIDTGINKEILRIPGGRITSISMSPHMNISIGSQTGALFSFALTDTQNIVELIPPSYSKSSRIWTSTWVSEKTLLVGSTYGKLIRIKTDEDEEEDFYRFGGHEHSIFGLDKTDNKYVVSGDYRGRVLVWKTNSELEKIQAFEIGECVQDIAWFKDQALAIVTKPGTIHYFESTDEENEGPLRWMYKVNLATGYGQCIAFSEDGTSIYAGTSKEIIQFDLDTLSASHIPEKNVVHIYMRNSRMNVLTSDALLEYEIAPVDIEIEYVKFKHIKISLLGYTGVGKSTLCNRLITGESGSEKSTFGKKLWTWIPRKIDDLECRIVLHDHGGQDSVLGTYLPFLYDSDIILILYKKTDRLTFERAVSALDALEGTFPDMPRVIFVQTFIDHDLDDIEAKSILDEMIRTGRITRQIDVSPTTGKGLDNLKKHLQDLIDWDTSRIVIKSEIAKRVQDLIFEVASEGVAQISLDTLRLKYHKKFGEPILWYHLQFLLRNLTSEGIIEYHPGILDSVIINDPNYNILRSKIPIYVRNNHGIVSFKALMSEFRKAPEFVDVLDEVYIQYGLCIKNDDIRIYPELLEDLPVSLPKTLRNLMRSNTINRTHVFQPMKRLFYPIIQRLSELNLQCVTASKKGGIFSWKENAVIYYTLTDKPDEFTGDRLHATWYIGGRKKDVCLRLNEEFERILISLLGAPEVL